METIRSLVHRQQKEMTAALQNTLIHCIAEKKGKSQPHYNREQNQGFGNRIRPTAGSGG